jgi:hypothetical protein
MAGTARAPEAAVAFAFGWRRAGHGRAPGASNIELAAAATTLGAKLPLVAESDVADALADRSSLIGVCGLLPGRTSVGTAGVARAAAAILHAKGCCCVVVIAHPGHRRRARACCRREGLLVARYPRLSIAYDPDSVQWWTRGPLRWWLREIPLRCADWVLYLVKPVIDSVRSSRPRPSFHQGRQTGDRLVAPGANSRETRAE